MACSLVEDLYFQDRLQDLTGTKARARRTKVTTTASKTTATSATTLTQTNTDKNITVVILLLQLLLLTITAITAITASSQPVAISSQASGGVGFLHRHDHGSIAAQVTIARQIAPQIWLAV